MFSGSKGQSENRINSERIQAYLEDQDNNNLLTVYTCLDVLAWDKENNYVGSGLRTGEELFKCSSLDELILVWRDGKFRKVQPEERIFVDKDLMAVLRYDQEKDRETRDFTVVYEDGGYKFSYIKRFRFGGLIRNKDYRLAPEKPKSRILFFQAGCPDTIYVKFKPAKNQRIHQQYFLPKE